MTLSISDTILDEEFRSPATGTADEHDVASLSAAMQTAITALTLTTLTGYTGFPQYAEKTNFVTIGGQVTDLFLRSSITGTPFPATGVATTLKVGGNTVFLFATSDPNIVVGRIGTGNSPDANGAVALVIGIEETKAGGLVTGADMWLALYAPLVHANEDLVDSADELDLSNLIYLGSNFNTSTEVPFSDFSKVPSGNPTFNVIFPTGTTADLQLLVTGVQGETQKTVNISTTGIGAGSQSTTVGTSIRIDTVSGFVQANVDANNELVPSAIDYTAHVNVVDASFQVTQTNPNHRLVDINVAAFKVSGNAQEQAFLTDALATDGAAVQIDAADVRILNAAGADITATFGGTITQVGDTVKITNLAVWMQVKFTTDGVNFDRMLITNVDSNDTFDIGNIKVTTLVGGTSSEYAELGSHLIFQDDGPNIDRSSTTAPTVTVYDSDFDTDPEIDFSSLFTTPDYGADGGGAVTYLLGVKSANVDSGLDDTLTGESILLSYDTATNTVSGKTSGAGLTVFVISVDADGKITLDQQRAIKHGDTTITTETVTLSAADLITISAKAVDSEAAGANDSDTATADIGTSFVFTDDGPSITGQAAGSSTPNDLEVGNVVNSTDSSSYSLDGGGDGKSSFNFINPDSTGSFTWAYFDVNEDTVTGNNEIKGKYNGSDLYTVVLNSDGTYQFKMIGTLPSSPLPLSAAEIKAGAPNTNSIDVGALGEGRDEYVTITGGGGAINESNAFVGVGNGNLDLGESLTFVLKEGDGDIIAFEGISIGTKSAQASLYNWSATPVGGGAAITGQASVGKNGTIVIDSDDLNDVMVNSITITKVSGSATKIGIGDIDILVPPNDVMLNFDVQLKDGDADPANASFTVSIDGNNDGNYDAVAISSFSAGESGTGDAMASSMFDGVWGMARVHGWHWHHYDNFI